MKSSLLKFLSACTLGTYGLLACSDSRTASTEVENEMRTLALTGLAATGAATALATVDFIAPSGLLLAQDTTDSSGTFHTTLSLSANQLPLLIRIQTDSVLLYTLLADSTADQSLDSLFVLANPLTSLVARALLGDTLAHPESGFNAPSYAAIHSQGSLIMGQLFGSDIDWAAFYQNPLFHPYIPSRPEQGAGTNDAILHTLGDAARAQGQSIDRYLDSLYASPQPQQLLEQDFRFQVATNMFKLGVDSSEATNSIREWEPEGSIELEDYYHALRENEQKGPPPLDSLPPDQEGARRAVDQALQLVPELLVGSENYSDAMENLPQLARIVFQLTNEAMLPLRTANTPPEIMEKCHPFTLEVAQQSVRLLVLEEPENWITDSLALTNAVRSILAEKVIGNFDLLAYAQSADPSAYYQSNYAPWRPTDSERGSTLQGIRSTGSGAAGAGESSSNTSGN